MPTHGSITKAGKVRKSTPVVPKSTKQKKLSPKLRNKRLYHLRALNRDGGLERPSGQWRKPE